MECDVHDEIETWFSSEICGFCVVRGLDHYVCGGLERHGWSEIESVAFVHLGAHTENLISSARYALIPRILREYLDSQRFK